MTGGRQTPNGHADAVPATAGRPHAKSSDPIFTVLRAAGKMPYHVRAVSAALVSRARGEVPFSTAVHATHPTTPVHRF